LVEESKQKKFETAGRGAKKIRRLRGQKTAEKRSSLYKGKSGKDVSYEEARIR